MRTLTLGAVLLLNFAPGAAALSGFQKQRLSLRSVTDCGFPIPAPQTSFLNTDGDVYLYFEVDVTKADIVRNDWIGPDGKLVVGASWPLKSGHQCFGTHSLFTSALPDRLMGDWKAHVTANGKLLFEIPFTLKAAPPSYLQRFNALSAACKQGLTSAMNTAGSSAATAAMLRMQALDRANADKAALETAAKANGIEWKLLAAIGVRETGFQNVSQPPPGKGEGIFQIDLGQNPGVTKKQADDPAYAAGWAASYLSKSEASIKKSFPTLSGDKLTDAAADSYNEGVTGVKNLLNQNKNPDTGTTGKNYGSNVLNLVQCFN
jgi:hypothetical protein